MTRGLFYACQTDTLDTLCISVYRRPMGKKHSLAEDLEVLLGQDHGLVVPLDDEVYASSTDFAKQIAEQSSGPVSIEKLRDMRMELLSRFSSGEIGSLMSERMLNRDQQLRTLSAMGPDVILDMMAEGLTLPRIAKRLEVSYGVLVEYMEHMVSEERISRAEELSADMMIDDAMEDLEDRHLDREEISRRNKLLDAAIKVGKAKSSKWVERKPEQQTLIQNNYGSNQMGAKSGTTAEGKRIVHGFQLVMSSDEDLPAMKAVQTPAVGEPKKPKDDPLIVNGEFSLVPEPAKKP